MFNNKKEADTRRLFLSISIIFCLVLFWPGGNNLFAQQNENPDFSLEVRAHTIHAQTKSVLVKKVGIYDRVSIAGLTNYAAPGAPLLPVKTVKFLVPYGQEVDGLLPAWTKKEKIEGKFLVEPAQHPVPMSFTGTIKPTQPDPAIYQSDTPYPGKVCELVSTQDLRGYTILIINLYPVEYIPASGELYYYQDLNIDAELKKKLRPISNPLFRGIPADRELVIKSVDNTDAVDTYPRNKLSHLAAVDYLIITSDSFASYAGTNNLNDLASQKQSYGLTSAIVNATTWGTYSGTRPDGGTDNATKVRNCINEYYTTHGTQYVLLVGDADYNDQDSGGSASGEREAAPIVPARGLYGYVMSGSGPEEDSDIPSDLYYACLGGTFDNDADGIYGETNDGSGGTDVDLLAEVYVGRAPVDSTTELANFVKKTIAYENSNADYLTSVTLAGEELDSSTYGKDALLEIQNGSSANGYTTVGMAGTGYFNFSTLFDKDASWTSSQLVDIINNGTHVLNHDGHANNTSLAAYKGFSNATADGLTNTDYFFGFTQGCYSGAFDNRDSGSSFGTEDAVLEHLVTGANGAFAFVGNSRYGWYLSGTTEGSSQRYHREFWDAMVGEGITNLGKALQDAKEDHVGIAGSLDAYRWSYFETNLLGDPHTPLSAAFLSPASFTATNVSFANTGWVTLDWTNSSRQDVRGAMVRYRTDGVYPTSETDGTLLCNRSATAGLHDSFNHTNVSANTTYHYVAFGYDNTTPTPVYEGGSATTNRDNTTILGAAGVGETGRSDCFVATACYGNPYAREITVLRKFRDHILLSHSAGRKFIAVYYAVGPHLASFIRDNDNLKCYTRKLLQPIVRCAQLLIKGEE